VADTGTATVDTYVFSLEPAPPLMRLLTALLPAVCCRLSTSACRASVGAVEVAVLPAVARSMDVRRLHS
jgi:hypothetical protein